MKHHGSRYTNWQIDPEGCLPAVIQLPRVSETARCGLHPLPPPPSCSHSYQEWPGFPGALSRKYARYTGGGGSIRVRVFQLPRVSETARCGLHPPSPPPSCSHSHQERPGFPGALSRKHTRYTGGGGLFACVSKILFSFVQKC